MNLSERAKEIVFDWHDWAEKEYQKVDLEGLESLEEIKKQALIPKIEEALRAVRDEALEESAKVAENYFSETTFRYGEREPQTITREVAEAIRSLREKS